MEITMITEKQKLARKRNWLLFRLYGMRSIFSFDNCKMMYRLLPKEKRYIVDKLDILLDSLIRGIKGDKYEKD